MSQVEIIEPVCDDIVDRLLAQIGFLSKGSGGTCAKVGDGRLFTEFGQIPAPFCFVQYAGESGQDPENLGAPPVIQVMRMRFQIWCGAKSFGPEGKGTEDRHGRYGLHAIIDAVWGALSGYLIPSLIPNAGSYSRLFHESNSPPVVEDHRVISISTWWTQVVRQGGSA